LANPYRVAVLSRAGMNAAWVQLFITKICGYIVRAGGPPARTKRGVKVACLLLYPALFYQRANVSAIRPATDALVFTWCDGISVPCVGEPHSGDVLDHRHLSVLEEMIESSGLFEEYRAIDVRSSRPLARTDPGRRCCLRQPPPRLLIFDTTGMSA
jgi:hypothetical protein